MDDRETYGRPHAPAMDRRRFLKLSASAAALGVGAVACGSGTGSSQAPLGGEDLGPGPGDLGGTAPDSGPPPDIGVEEPDVALPSSYPRSWDPPYPDVYYGYRGLSDLPWFALDERGLLRCTLDDLPSTVDIHTHLGFDYLLAPPIDLHAAPPLKYLIRQVEGEPPFQLTLDCYLNRVATESMRRQLDRDVMACGAPGGSAVAATHTIPNLLDEMDRNGVARAVVLPIAMHLTPDDDAPERWLRAIREAKAEDRLIGYASVHPEDPDCVNKLRSQVGLGAAGLKIHPSMQRVMPDCVGAMALYGECGSLGIPVFWHVGRTGLEKKSQARFAEGERYEAPVREYPKTRFVMGHIGAHRDWELVLRLAQECPNVVLDMAGQGMPVLRRALALIGPERMMFGTDWPFYPEAPTLAKVLLLAAGDRGLRDTLLADTAELFLGA